MTKTTLTVASVLRLCRRRLCCSAPGLHQRRQPQWSRPPAAQNRRRAGRHRCAPIASARRCGGFGSGICAGRASAPVARGVAAAAGRRGRGVGLAAGNWRCRFVCSERSGGRAGCECARAPGGHDGGAARPRDTQVTARRRLASARRGTAQRARFPSTAVVRHVRRDRAVASTAAELRVRQRCSSAVGSRLEVRGRYRYLSV